MSEQPQKRTRVRTHVRTLAHMVFVDAFTQLSHEDAEACMRKLIKRHYGLAQMWLGLYPPYARTIYRMFGCVTYAEWKRLKARLNALMAAWTHGWVHTSHYNNPQNCIHLFTGCIPLHGSEARLDGKHPFNRMVTGWIIDKFHDHGDDRYPTAVGYDEFMQHVWDLNCIPYVDGVPLLELLA